MQKRWRTTLWVHLKNPQLVKINPGYPNNGVPYNQTVVTARNPQNSFLLRPLWMTASELCLVKRHEKALFYMELHVYQLTRQRDFA